VTLLPSALATSSRMRKISWSAVSCQQAARSSSWVRPCAEGTYVAGSGWKVTHPLLSKQLRMPRRGTRPMRAAREISWLVDTVQCLKIGGSASE
jgi:hypothetical protein